MIGIVVVWTFISLCKKKSMRSTLISYLKEYKICICKWKNVEIDYFLHNVYLISWNKLLLIRVLVIVHSVDQKIHPSIVPLIPAISTAPI